MLTRCQKTKWSQCVTCVQERRLKLNGKQCQRQILHMHWSQHVTNAEISPGTGLPPVVDFIGRRHLSVFGHIARLTQGNSAHNALHCQSGLASGRSLGRDWRRRPGRPRARWSDQLRNYTESVPANLWRQAILRGHGGATRLPELATRWRRRRVRRILRGFLGEMASNDRRGWFPGYLFGNFRYTEYYLLWKSYTRYIKTIKKKKCNRLKSNSRYILH